VVYNVICLLTEIGMTPDDNSAVHFNTQNTQNNSLRQKAVFRMLVMRSASNVAKNYRRGVGEVFPIIESRRAESVQLYKSLVGQHCNWQSLSFKALLIWHSTLGRAVITALYAIFCSCLQTIYAMFTCRSDTSAFGWYTQLIM
jgi:hypothetical protein